jgi:hypothetical protein
MQHDIDAAPPARQSRRLAYVALLALFGLAAAGRAQALEWSWSYVNAAAGIAASGALETGALEAGSYPITAVSGVWAGAAITGLEPARSCCSPPGWNSNLLIDGEPRLDKGGVAFSAAAGRKINIFYKDGRYAYEVQNGPEVFGGAFAAAPVGER